MKNAIVFKAELPVLENLENDIQEVLFKDITENEVITYGFEVNEVTGELITPLEGGNNYAIQLRIDEKVIPSSVVKKMTDERLKEKFGDQKIKKADRSDVKLAIYSSLLPKALVKTTIVTAYYDADNHYLVVDTTRDKFASMIITMLIKCCGSVKTSTIHVSDLKYGITTKVKNYLHPDNKEPMECFDLGRSCMMMAGKVKKGYVNTDLVHQADGILKDIDSGLVVDTIELENDGVEFTLTSKFHFKKFKFPKVDAPKDDKPYHWRHEASVHLLQVSAIVTKTCEMVGYQAELDLVTEEIQEKTSFGEDFLYPQVVELVKESKRCSVSNIQRKFKIGYNRAALLVEKLEADGIVSAPGHNGNREVFN